MAGHCARKFAVVVVIGIGIFCWKFKNVSQKQAKPQKMDNHFTEIYLRQLAADQVQGNFTPFNKNDIGKVQRYIKGMLGRLSDNHKIVVTPDYKAYGSGFASYINVKISKKDKSDTKYMKNGKFDTEQKDGLLLYISLLAPYWYFGKGDWWENYSDGQFRGGSSNFLMPESIQQYNQSLWKNEVEQITRLFEEYRYALLTKKEVETPLWFDVKIVSNLGDTPYTVFDCFFHWED
jgi:hypothetical protein